MGRINAGPSVFAFVILVSAAAQIVLGKDIDQVPIL
jgi:hypothetical protein